MAAPLSGATDALNTATRLIAEAARRRADLVVLPECAYPAYCIGSVEAYRCTAKLSPDEYVGTLSRLAQQFHIHIVSGFVEEAGTALANAAVLIGADGRELGRHRKTFLWDRDNEWFTPGGRIDTFESDLGRIGLIICAEARCPEVVATLAAKGADLLAMPTCWFNTARRPGEYTNPQAEFLIQVRASEFGIPFVCADKSGHDGADPGYCGLSQIVDRDGKRLAEAPGTGEALIVSRVGLRTAPTRPIPRGQRDRILSADEPILPRDDAPPVTVAVVPGEDVRRRMEERGGKPFFETLKGQGVQVLATAVAEETAAKVATAARPFGIEALGWPSWAGVQEIGRDAARPLFRSGGLPGEAIRRFAPTRVLTLNGASVVLVFGGPHDLLCMRARALENRVYVVGATEERATIIAPDGSVIAMTDVHGPATLVATIAPSLAADKRMAPRTDVFGQRQLHAFEF